MITLFLTGTKNVTFSRTDIKTLFYTVHELNSLLQYNKVYNKAIIQSIGLRKMVAHKQILEQFVLSNGLP